MRALKTASPRNAKPTMMMTTPFNQLYVRPHRSSQATEYQANNITNPTAMKKIPIATVAISSSTAAVLLVTPVMPKPTILSLRQIPTGRESLGFGRSPSQEPPEQPCRGACQCHKNPRHDKPGRNVSEGRFGPCVLHDPARKEHAKKREESPGDDKHGRPPPPRGGR